MTIKSFGQAFSTACGIFKGEALKLPEILVQSAQQ